ncbi:phage tail protein [Rhizobium laguerreae]|uniref:phage tail protein n=1 Tax=Rhizobium laguerreae TaxID=1076926 RepID=UPI001C8FFFBE|nr:phage tail protein [Rhizobium laguerreae]MBY3434813.1 phage tail protein [Rhizobium laguerreae]MBY3448956.1 phage tail protein [Rhizobium laguerreae]MBY3456730.1 phage tail protein [Rhizobium laguerreae]
MSGPTAMALGPFAFEAIGFGYEGVQRKVQTPWADVAVVQSLNQQQWTGPTTEEVTINGVLFPAQFGGQTSLDGIIAAAMSGTPLMLVSGDAVLGMVHGTFTIQSVDEDKSYFTNTGTPRKNSYSITLKRYSQSAAGGGLFSPILNLFG